MKFTLFILSLFLLFSCQKKSQFSYDGERVSIEPTSSEITDITPIIWKAGIMRNITISRGVQVTFTFPQFENKDLRYLVDKYGVDSWIVRVKRKGMMRNETIGYLYVPIILPGQKNAMRINQLKKGSFRILYSASSVSARFSNSPCPAFKHDLLIEKTEVGSEKPFSSKISVSPVEEERLLVAVEDFNYSNTSLNGGKELRGDYYVDIAFYNKERKTKISNFIELDGSAKVVRERSIPLSGCENYKIPPRMDDGSGINQFKWNK
ncbi:hypothetical protein BIY24_13545 [Halobacteriovorax marinus]|uniref:hypothetical protein n=1 Tax=Halobacteriovorax marinus TaxID=97084 RepID=UPI000BC305CD|nr:hypothetical protein [Halobacteriovorax marinus]ATH08933.1 hypothetical protein BIY24_13545 [Halobacteriovorax marinus]